MTRNRDFTPVPVTIRGVTYSSEGEAARALGVLQTTISKALEQGRLDTVALNPRGRRIAKAVTVNGVRYKSSYAAGKALGIHPATITRKMRECSTSVLEIKAPNSPRKNAD